MTYKVPFATISCKRSSMESDSKDSLICNNQEELLKSTRAKMGEMREENERLRVLLARITEDCRSLKKHISDHENERGSRRRWKSDQDDQQPQLVCLTLGRPDSICSDQAKKYDKVGNGELNRIRQEENLNDDKGLELGLDCKFDATAKDSTKNSSMDKNCEESSKVEAAEAWPRSTSFQTMGSREEDQSLHQAQLKKARVSVRVRCNTTTMNDGCQWRKYGQKISKGNPCPRAYYRCTMSPSCPVRKQVQRCAEDMSVLITTYEGTHNHPLPNSATTISSATSAAASTLQSGSSSSQASLRSDPSNSINTAFTTSAFLNGLDFSYSTLNPTSFNLSNSAAINTISTHHSHPTITLDLTTPNSSSLFNWAPRKNFAPSAVPTLDTGHQNYGVLSHKIGSELKGNHQISPSQQYLSEGVAATTKGIASDPNFQSILAAAITPYVGRGENNSGGLNLKLGESFAISYESRPSTQKGLG